MKDWRGGLPPLARIVKNRQGQTLVEYGLVLILIAVVVALAVLAVGYKTSNVYSAIGNGVPQPTP